MIMDAVLYTPFTSPVSTSCANCCRFSFGVTYTSPFRRSSFSRRFSNSLFCRSSNPGWRWDSILRDAIKIALSPLKSYITGKTKNVSNDVSDKDHKAEEDWDWGQWKRHFEQIDDHERVFSVLKSQLDLAIIREDYENAAKIKVAIAAVATNDAVGKVMFHLHKAIKEERYQDAAAMRDYAGAGLVGWWAGISSNTDNPSGHVIHISAEYGRYVARSYSPGHLATSNVGVPLFEVFLTNHEEYGYKQQVVYLKPMATSQMSPASIKSSDNNSTHQSSDSSETSSNEITGDASGTEDDRAGNSDVVSGMVDSQNILKNMIPGLKISVIGVTSPSKVDPDFKFKFLELPQGEVSAEEDEKNDKDKGYAEEDEKDNDDAEIDASQNEIEQGKDTDESSGYNDDILDEKKMEFNLKVIIGEIMLMIFNNLSTDIQRVPAKLIKMGHSSFSFSTCNGELKDDCISEKEKLANKKFNFHRRRIGLAVLKLSNSLQKQMVPLQVVNDVEKLVSLTLNRVGNHQPLSEVTIFNRIETPAWPDPLNGLYVGIFGNFSSGVIHLRSKFGKWQDDGDEASDIKFYEYVEAIKLTGDQYIPAGQVAFRAKVGKKNQIPLKGLIPEELGVMARYSGQGRIAEPGFQNPRWVNGELIILDGKRLKGGPVIGFLYWALEYQSFVLFNRVNLH